MASIISIPFKKEKQTNLKTRATNMQVCSCADEDIEDNNYECEFHIDNRGGRYEFFEIQLLGGGAAGGSELGGAAGEAKIITYPSLPNGNYLIKLGAGGQASGNINGGDTILYKINGTGNYEIIEFARGGIGSNEKMDLTLSAERQEELKTGEPAAFNWENSTCGSGGDKGTNGQHGEAIIKW